MMTVEIKTIVMRTIHHIKQIAIRLVFLCSPLTLCTCVLSSNSIRKQCDNNHSVSSQITYSCTQLNHSTTNSEIRILNPLNATISSLSHTD